MAFSKIYSKTLGQIVADGKTEINYAGTKTICTGIEQVDESTATVYLTARTFVPKCSAPVFALATTVIETKEYNVTVNDVTVWEEDVAAEEAAKEAAGDEAVADAIATVDDEASKTVGITETTYDPETNTVSCTYDDTAAETDITSAIQGEGTTILNMGKDIQETLGAVYVSFNSQAARTVEECGSNPGCMLTDLGLESTGVGVKVADVLAALKTVEYFDADMVSLVFYTIEAVKATDGE